MRLWPMYALSMPNELAWQRFTCWRCKGSGQLPENDPYIQRPSKIEVAVLIWWFCFAGSCGLIILFMLWP
jgi:hypothetical protein